MPVDEHQVVGEFARLRRGHWKCTPCSQPHGGAQAPPAERHEQQRRDQHGPLLTADAAGTEQGQPVNAAGTADRIVEGQPPAERNAHD
jgi:hypothetical protein